MLSEDDKRPDTLYFITEYEKDNNNDYVLVNGEKKPINTSLYLGSVMVSNGKDETILPEDLNIKLNHLIDVDLNYGLEDKTLLSYDYENSLWIPVSITDIISNFDGATNNTDGQIGFVPKPLKGDQNKVLTGDGKWTSLEIPNISTLESQMSILINEDENKSIRDIAADELLKQLIPENAKEALDSLKEISEWIQSHPDDVSQINSKISNIEKDLKTVESQALFTAASVGQLESLLGAEKTEDGKITSLSEIEKINIIINALEPQYDENNSLVSLKTIEKINVIETVLGVQEDSDSGTIIITAAPIGNLADLMLYKEAENEDNKPSSIVDAINILTEKMTWGNLSS